MSVGTFEDFESSVRSLVNMFGSELPKTKQVRESLQESYELGLYIEDAYWRALDS